MSTPIAATPGGAQAQALPKSERQRLRAGTGAMFTRRLRLACGHSLDDDLVAPTARCSTCSPASSPTGPPWSVTVLSGLLEIFFLRSPMPEGNTMMVEWQVSIDTIDAINLSLVAHRAHRDQENAPCAATWRSRSICTPRSAHSACSPCPSRALQPRKRAMRTWRCAPRNIGMFASPVVSSSVPRHRAAAKDT
jgi:hypothetical protein